MNKSSTRWLPLAIAVTLSACATDIRTTQTANEPAVAQASIIPAVQLSNTVNSNTEITLEKIMSDPDWMGRQPESAYWASNSQTIFFKQKREGNPLRDLYQIDLMNETISSVPLAKLHEVAVSNPIYNATRTEIVYTFEGNIYVKNIATQQVQQLTYTSAIESQPQFLLNGDIAYRTGNSFFVIDRKSSKITEIALLTLDDKPKAKPDSSFIAQEQAKLIQFIAKKQRIRELQKQQSDALLAQNPTVTNNQYYLGKNKTIRDAVLSPSGKLLVVSVADKEERDDSNIMPNYVTESGKIIAEPARRRVADNREYHEELVLIDLQNQKIIELPFTNLPGFDDDVLASVKAENYRAQGKTYISKKQPRQFYLTSVEQPIQWNASGTQVAIMLNAWDNKDRWIVTVDLSKGLLVPQHRLHDDAWINWNFNEFGWLNDSTLYYTSEESGYSHLYVKPLNSQAKKITSGRFEVSDVTLTPDHQAFVFRANKKHPGIYEIYRVSADGSQFTALTNLGGMNNYQLSPDGKQLLIEHSSVTMPPELYLQQAEPGATAKQMTHTVSKEFLAMPWTAPSVVAVKSSHQDAPIYSRVYLPKTADTTKRKAIIFIHGAGYLQNAHLGWSGYFREFMFHSMLTQQGYVVMDMDYRASAGYGRDWRTAIYRHMGKPEVEDLKDGVNWLIANANVDAHKVATYGGSYGGFLTLMALFTEPDLFQSGAALRLVSDWAYYNHGYTSNILNTPKDDPIAYRRSSPIYFAEGLSKPLLINAPMVDSNVFFEDSVRLMQRLIELEKKDVEIAIFPVESHGFVEPSSWLHEYRRIYHLFETTLQ
jgi:dipeptidyl aminopeptidase/acylaminoacyl peptidase